MLTRHERRRHGDLPAISVLVGPGEYAAQCWSSWLAEDARQAFVCTEASSEALLLALVEYLFQYRDILTDIVAVYRQQSDHTVPEHTVDALHRAGAPERAAFLQTIAAAGMHADVLFVAERLCDRLAAGGERASELAAALHDPIHGWQPALRGLVRCVPGDALPGVLLAPGSTGYPAHDWLPAAVRAALALAELSPRLTLAITCAAQALDEFLQSGGESRGKAMMREGLISLESAAAGDPPGRDAGDDTSDSPAVQVSLDRLRQLDAGDELREAFHTAARTREQARRASPTDRDSQDRARSAAERLLYQALEATAETAGLFQLNERIDIVFGRAPMEIDLLAKTLDLAVEIDGYYHFQNHDAYRRDRRKDLLLQTNRYLVMRFLADDVVPELAEILDRITEIIRWRRQS
ncbi:MAG: DUF559 domain-containing protein [Myxococcota bacterium]